MAQKLTIGILVSPQGIQLIKLVLNILVGRRRNIVLFPHLIQLLKLLLDICLFLLIRLLRRCRFLLAADVFQFLELLLDVRLSVGGLLLRRILRRSLLVFADFQVICQICTRNQNDSNENADE